jgi:hypothetical protein
VSTCQAAIDATVQSLVAADVIDEENNRSTQSMLTRC